MSKEDDIRDNLLLILSTPPGKRIDNPAFGCDFSMLLFEIPSEKNILLAKEEIARKIMQFETRVQLQTTDIQTDRAGEGFLIIQIEYTIVHTKSLHMLSYTFPFLSL